jgi:hypothetical protein
MREINQAVKLIIDNISEEIIDVEENNSSSNRPIRFTINKDKSSILNGNRTAESGISSISEDFAARFEQQSSCGDKLMSKLNTTAQYRVFI